MPPTAPTVELVVLMGLQASGKSSFARERFGATHVVISKDDWPNERRRQERLLRVAREQLAAGSSIVIDNTNVAVEDRAPLVALGRGLGARVVGFWMSSEVEACFARNAEREGRRRVPDVGFYATVGRMQRPSVDEGFDELHLVRLVPPDGFAAAPCSEVPRGS